MNYCDQAIEILGATNDGDDLAPEHLKLVELVVNGWVNEAGEVAFQELYESVKAGYKKPWLHGIEHLTIDHEGYVYWKGQQVEHYTLGWHRSEEAAEAARELADRCRRLEAAGRPVNSVTAIWAWPQSLWTQHVVDVLDLRISWESRRKGKWLSVPCFKIKETPSQKLHHLINVTTA